MSRKALKRTKTHKRTGFRYNVPARLQWLAQFSKYILLDGSEIHINKPRGYGRTKSGEVNELDMKERDKE